MEVREAATRNCLISDGEPPERADELLAAFDASCAPWDGEAAFRRVLERDRDELPCVDARSAATVQPRALGSAWLGHGNQVPDRPCSDSARSRDDVFLH